VAALKTDSAFYIMTSARDILLDVFEPSLCEGRFTSGLFVLCRYSLQPFAAGMSASGIRGCMFPFHQGDCRNYRAWLQADRGIKEEQTEIHDSTRAAIERILASAAKQPTSTAQFQKQENVFFVRGARNEQG
jgi:hypothetical protein